MRRLAALAVALMLSVPAWAAELKGVALVIGESKYETLGTLANPNQDARAIDDLLDDLGFEVDRVLNADADRLREAIEEFIENAEDADVALVYYSGHGIEVGGENYLVPVDATFDTPEAAGASLVAVAPMLEALSKVAPVTIVLLDACRSDPFPAGTVIKLPDSDVAVTLAPESGLAPVRGPTPAARRDLPPESMGTVIGFAAEPGRPALDGPAGENSPYAAALLKHLSAGGFSFGDVMTMVTEEVYLKTKAQQLPWTNSSLRRVLTFAAPEEADPDQSAIQSERRKLLLTIAGTPEETRGYVEALAGQEDVPLDALYGMLNVLGVKVTDAGGDIEQQLQRGAERLKELIVQRSTAVKADPELERLSSLAASAEEEGAIALALQYRDQASARADDLLTKKQEEAEKLRQDMIDIAQTYADNAATALLNFDHAHAAELYGKAYEAVRAWDPNKAFTYKLGQGDALYDQGYYKADNAALLASLDAYGLAETLAPRSQTPVDWATLQDRRGQSLQTLGDRVTDDSVLEQSLAAYRAALEVRTEADTPQDWARTQNNLANTYYTIGKRRHDMAMIRQAVEAFDASLTVFTPEADPVRWATVESNKAAAGVDLADMTYAASDDAEMAAYAAGNEDPRNIPEVVAARDAANAILDAALADLDEAMGALDKARSPFDWAMLSHTLASAYTTRGEMNHAPDDLRRAADIFRDVLTVHTAERMPAQWIRTSNNLAIALKKLSDETGDPASLREAIGIYKAVVERTSKTDQPLDWASYQVNLGHALGGLADYEEDAVPTLTAALDAYHAASEFVTIDWGVAAWQGLQTSLSTTLLMRGIKSFNKADVLEAQTIALGARDTLARLGVDDSGFYGQYLPMIDNVLALFPQ